MNYGDQEVDALGAAFREKIERLERELAEARVLLDSEIRARNRTADLLQQAQSDLAQSRATAKHQEGLATAAKIALEQARAELEAVRKERDDARSDAVCHCGALMHEHTLSDNHVAKPMEHRCPNEARIAQLEAVVREKLREAVNIGFMNNTAFLSGEDGVDVEKWINYTIAAALGGNGEVG